MFSARTPDTATCTFCPGLMTPTALSTTISVLASPSIWWDGRAVLAGEEEWAAANDDLPASVFFSYGEQETSPDIDPQFSMGDNVEELVATLKTRNYPGLRMSHEVLAGDGHSSSIGAAVSHGLRALV